MPDSQEYTQAPGNNDQIDLTELFAGLWRGKATILGITILAAVLSVATSLYLPNIYTSSALLAPNNSEVSRLSQIGAQYGGLASLAGINLGGNIGSNEQVIAVETLKSQRFFRDFLYEAVLVELMAVSSWQSDSNTLVVDSDIYDRQQSRWIREVDSPKKRRPSVQEAFAVFSALSTISEDKPTGLVTISIDHLSPFIAKQWTDLMVAGINEAMRAQAIDEAQRSIDYILEQREKTALVSLDEMFAQLLEEQTKAMMLAQVSDEYVFQVIESPFVSEVKSKPRRALLCLLGTLLGVVVGILVVLLFYNHHSNVKPKGVDHV